MKWLLYHSCDATIFWDRGIYFSVTNSSHLTCHFKSKVGNTLLYVCFYFVVCGQFLPLACISQIDNNVILKFGIRQALFRFIERNMYIYHSFNGHCIFNEIIRIHFNFVAASNAGMILYLCMTTTNDYLTLYRGKYYIISVI